MVPAAGAAQGWRGVIGHLPGGKRAGYTTRGVVADRNDRWHLWRSKIDFDAPGVGRLADVALRIRGSDGKVMRPFAEGGFRSKCPDAGTVCCHGTNLRGAIKMATTLFGSAVPVRVGVVSLVGSPLGTGVAALPALSVTLVITGVVETVSTTMVIPADGVLSLPAGSVAVTVRVWLPSSSAGGV